MLELRQYQKEAIAEIYASLKRGIRKPLVVMPTGSGKSVTLCEFIRSAYCEKGARKIVSLVDSRELISQNEAALKRKRSQAKTGIYNAGLKERNLNAPIIFGGIQSIYRKAYDLGKIDIIVVDECHMIPRDCDTRYGKFISSAIKANPNVVIVGFTATPFRLDTGMLTSGDDALFEEIVYDTDIIRLIDEGYLCPIISKGGVDKINLEDVHTRMGDYVPGELATAADNEKLIKSAIDEVIKYGSNRNAWLIFCAGVQHAQHVTDELKERGINAEIVTGDTSQRDRDSIVHAFKNRQLKCLVNVGVFQKGFDAPETDLLVLLTATKSVGRYIQMIGRAMRIAPGKENALILDMGTNIERMGTLDNITVPKGKTKGEGTGEPPCKECPECHDICAASVRFCPACYHEFPEKPKHESEAYDGAVLSNQESAKWVDLSDPPEYLRWPGKNNKPDTIRCNFYAYTRKQPYCMWLALDHGGYAARKAREYITACGGTSETVGHALKEQ